MPGAHLGLSRKRPLGSCLQHPLLSAQRPLLGWLQGRLAVPQPHPSTRTFGSCTSQIQPTETLPSLAQVLLSSSAPRPPEGSEISRLRLISYFSFSARPTHRRSQDKHGAAEGRRPAQGCCTCHGHPRAPRAPRQQAALTAVPRGKPGRPSSPWALTGLWGR